MPSSYLSRYKTSLSQSHLWSTVCSICRVIRNLFPLTFGGVTLAIMIYYVWFREIGAHANQILYGAITILIFTWALLLLFTIGCSVLVYGMTRSRNKDAILECKNEVGGHIDSSYAVYHPFFLPFISIETAISESSSFVRHETQSSLWQTEWLEPIARGRFENLHRKITVKDIFGLTSITFVMTQKVALEILPAMSKFEMLAFQTQATGDGYSHPEGDPKGELVEMRRYQAGDPLKLILWKVFARSRKLVVRAPEPAIVEQNDMFIYFISGQQDEASASIARSFLSFFGVDNSDLCFAADGSKRIATDKKDGINDIIDSVQHQSRGGEDLMTIAPLVAPHMMAHCFLLVPQKVAAWLDYVKKFIAQYGIQPVFIVSVDSKLNQSQAKKPSRWQKLWQSSDKSKNDTDDLERLCDALKPLGSVRIIDIETGATRNL